MASETTPLHTIALIEDHPVVRAGLRCLIEDQDDLTLAGEADTVAGAMQIIKEKHPELAVVDVRLKNGDGLDLAADIRSQCPTTRVLVLSMHDDQTFAERALRAGASGFINKQEPAEELLKAIRMVLAGRIYLRSEISEKCIAGLVRGPGAGHDDIGGLSNRELQVFEMLGEGQGIATIAEHMGLSAKTVETYRWRIRQKLGAASSNELIARAARWLERKP